MTRRALPRLLFLWGLALGLALAGAARAQDATPVPTPTSLSAPPIATAAPTPAPPPDGAIERLTPLHVTPHSAYYALTYWSDGLRVTGFLGRPTSPGPHPAIIHNRGGYDGVGALTGIEIVPWVEAGYVAVASQYRGNAGSEGREDFGGADVHDVTALIPLLHSLPFVDGERIGMFGGSRGGMMTFLALKAQALAGDDAIKAAVTVGAISDLTRWDRERGGTLAAELWRPLIGATPAEAPALFAERSAIHWPELITVPLLLLHGLADRDVSPQQTRLLAEALREAGAPVEAIFYSGGDHALSAQHGGVPDALAWFARYLGGDGVDRSFAAHEADIAAVSTWFMARGFFPCLCGIRHSTRRIGLSSERSNEAISPGDISPSARRTQPASWRSWRTSTPWHTSGSWANHCTLRWSIFSAPA